MAGKILKAQRLSERDMLEQKYRNARMNFLLVVMFTVINVLLAVTNADLYFLFSATIPYLLAALSMLFCGLYPPEYYAEVGIDIINPWPSEVLIVALVLAAVIITLYLLAFFLSSKGRVGWLIFALVLFGIDTVVLFLYFGIDVTRLVDYIFHVFVIVILAGGIRAHYKLKSLPEEPAEALVTESGDAPATECDNTVTDSVSLRIADMNVKSKVLLAAEKNGKQIIYRRVKKTNELVIGGYVYDEYVALMEFPHTLVAVVDGHTVEAGMSQNSQAFITVDGEVVAKKLRLI